MTDKDLISREALKKAFDEYGEKAKFTQDFCQRLIDNAPTVTSSLNLDNITKEDIEKFKIIWQRATSKGLPTFIEDRPQGEWIECTKSCMPLTEYGRMTGEKWYGFKCSQCNSIYKGNALIESPFCQKCGAYMRKGGKE